MTLKRIMIAQISSIYHILALPKTIFFGGGGVKNVQIASWVVLVYKAEDNQRTFWKRLKSTKSHLQDMNDVTIYVLMIICNFLLFV